MTTDYLPLDALIHTRESLKNTLNWVQEYLADHYGLEWIAGEEYLPDPLEEVMAVLGSITNEVTDMTVQVGAYRRREDGALMRPKYYSTMRPVYSKRLMGPVGEEIECTCLEHPGGQSHPTVEADTPRAELRVIPGGAGNE